MSGAAGISAVHGGEEVNYSQRIDNIPEVLAWIESFLEYGAVQAAVTMSGRSGRNMAVVNRLEHSSGR